MWKKIRHFFLIETYLLSIKKKLYYPKKTKQKIIKRLRKFIGQACAEDKKIITIQQDIYEMLGTADKVVSDYMQLRLEDEARQYEAECAKAVKFSKLKSVLVVISLAVLIFFIFIIAWNYWISRNFKVVMNRESVSESSFYEEGQ